MVQQNERAFENVRERRARGLAASEAQEQEGRAGLWEQMLPM